MSISKPAGSPVCWGLKFQDGDRECDQCRWNDTCRSKMMEVMTSAPPPRAPVMSLPMFGAPRGPTGTVPMPPPRPATLSPFSAPPPPPAAPMVAQVRYPPVPQPPPQQQYAQQQYTQQSYAIPDPYNPNPMAPMYRPGAQGPAYYFNQYPEEGVAARLTKNIFLRGLEAVFTELMFFFRHWTWPPRY